MQSRNARVALSAAVLAFAFIYTITAVLFRQAFLYDPDTLLHITIGKWILQHGQFPVIDQFSYTALGKPWYATDWIGELGLVALYNAAHWRGVTEAVVLTSALISGALCYYLTTKLRLSVAFGLAVCIVALISPHFLARPVVFSYLLLSIWLILTLELEEQDKWAERQAFILVPLIVLWANTHGSFTFGLTVFFIFVCNAALAAYLKRDFRRLKRLAILFVSVVAAGVFITPYGPFATIKTVKLLSNPAVDYIIEWHTPDFQKDPIHLAAIVGLFGLMWYFGIRVRGPRLFTLILVTIFALEYKRGLGLFAMVVPLLLVHPFSMALPWIGVQSGVHDPVIQFANRRVGTIATICAAVVVATGVLTWIINGDLQPPLQRSTNEAIAAVKSASIKGNVLNTYGFGGYLIFDGIPPFVDGRVELYGKQFLQRYFDAMYLTKPNEVAALLKQYNIGWALLQPNEPIIFALKANGWTQIFADQSAVVLAKNP